MFEKSLQLRNNIEEVERLLDELEQACAQLGGATKPSRELLIAVEELFVNVVNYAFTDGGEHKIEIRLCGRERRISVELSDDGRPFNPLADAPIPDLEAPLEDRQIGGLGVFLATKLVDSFDYRRHDGKNIVSVTKTLAGS